VRQAAQKAGGHATLFRGGAFKPRTSPYDFQGLGKPALEMLKEAREQTGLPIVTANNLADAAEKVVKAVKEAA